MSERGDATCLIQQTCSSSYVARMYGKIVSFHGFELYLLGMPYSMYSSNASFKKIRHGILVVQFRLVVVVVVPVECNHRSDCANDSS